MSGISRRNTRSASRAASIEPAPSVGGSARSTRSGTRRAENNPNPNLRSKSTQLYGTTGEIDRVARRQQQEGMEKAVNRIQEGLGASTQGGATGGRLSAVVEEEQGDSVGGGNVSRSAKSQKVSKLTAKKTFGRETVISSEIGNENWRENVDNWEPDQAFVEESPPKVPVWKGLSLTFSFALFWLSFFFLITSTVWMLWRWTPTMKGLTHNHEYIMSLPTELNKMSRQIGMTNRQINMADRQIGMTDHRLDMTIDRLDDATMALHDHQARLDAYDRQNPRRINYFSFDLGARVNPYLTSPRMMRLAYTPHFYWLAMSSWFGYSTLKLKMTYTSKNSDQALKGWMEPLDRWCAPSDRGKLQLAVIMPRSIAPDLFVIEHFPKSELIMFGAAPKEVELWIRIMDEHVRGAVKTSVSTFFPDIMSPTVPQGGKTLDQKQALDETWVLVGRWKYKIDNRKNVQGFEIPSDLHGLGVSANEAAVRVNSNWGNLDATCLYRVVLHGKDVSGITEWLEEEEP